MKIKLLIFIFTSIICISLTNAQVKIGNNPSIINGESILELESSNKVLVITRMTTTQMNAVTPLRGALVYNTDVNCVFMYTVNWKSLCGTSSMKVTTAAAAPLTNSIGDFWIDDTKNDLVHIWDGSKWMPIKTHTKANNGLSVTSDNKVQLGGGLLKPTLITATPTNTLAIKGLQKGDVTQDDIVTVDKNTGVLKKVDSEKILKQEDLILPPAVDGQVIFNAGFTLKTLDKINVYRNGVRISFTIINNTTIEIEPEAKCYTGDQIRIVQFY